MRVPSLAGNLGEPSTRVMHAGLLTTLPLKPFSSQRSNHGIENLSGIVWFELYLQAPLSAIQEYA